MSPIVRKIEQAGAVAADGVVDGEDADAAGQKLLGVPLELDNLHVAFGARKVLQGLTLDIPARQFVAVVGRSGVGKSTLMRLIVGLDRPNDGRVLIDGNEVTSLQKSVRLLFQDARLLPWQTVLSNGPASLSGIQRCYFWTSRLGRSML
jgi:ABC-type bacteriocin/lantibiotic exporter with double-glycine peptidase domain